MANDKNLDDFPEGRQGQGHIWRNFCGFWKHMKNKSSSSNSKEN
jgi:hypothetical protein